jgi:hypothetical protein
MICFDTLGWHPMSGTLRVNGFQTAVLTSRPYPSTSSSVAIACCKLACCNWRLAC